METPVALGSQGSFSNLFSFAVVLFLFTTLVYSRGINSRGTEMTPSSNSSKFRMFHPLHPMPCTHHFLSQCRLQKHPTQKLSQMESLGFLLSTPIPEQPPNTVLRSSIALAWLSKRKGDAFRGFYHREGSTNNSN